MDFEVSNSAQPELITICANLITIQNEPPDDTHLVVFGAIKHESELYEGTPRIRCNNNWSESNAQSKEPILHVGYVEDVLCRAPQIGRAHV